VIVTKGSSIESSCAKAEQKMKELNIMIKNGFMKMLFGMAGQTKQG